MADAASRYCHNCGHWANLPDGVHCAWCLHWFYAHGRMPGDEPVKADGDRPGKADGSLKPLTVTRRKPLTVTGTPDGH